MHRPRARPSSTPLHTLEPSDDAVRAAQPSRRSSSRVSASSDALRRRVLPQAVYTGPAVKYHSRGGDTWMEFRGKEPFDRAQQRRPDPAERRAGRRSLLRRFGHRLLRCTARGT